MIRDAAYGALCMTLALGLLATAAVLWAIEETFGVGRESPWGY